MTATYNDTKVNGIGFRNWSHDDSQTARQFAAALPRGCDVVDMIKTHHRNKIKVWLDDTGPADEMARIDVPDGWTVTQIGVSSNGRICLTVRQDGGD